jgi:predicted acyltransferase
MFGNREAPAGNGQRTTANGQSAPLEAPAAAPATTGRLGSVDALRGLTILLMVFVNDLGPAAPSWMHHIEPPNADGMTLADVVFPIFLFIVGVSIPLALKRGLQPGAERLAQLRHIVTRTLGLLFMGLVELNHERDRALGRGIWGTLAFAAILLAWCALPRDPGWKRTTIWALKTVGAVGLVVLLAVFRGEPVSTELLFWGPVEGWVWLRTEWWGILGLIGWAYFVVALLWLMLGNRREWLMGALAVLILFHMAMQHGGLFTRLDYKPWLGSGAQVLKLLAQGIAGINEYVGLADATGSLAAVTMAGCLLGTILRRGDEIATHRDRLRWASMLTIGLFVAGLLTDTFEGINKIAGTPTWCLWSAALACAAWIVLYQVMDVAGYGKWSILVRPAGANPLVAYFLHPITVTVIAVAGLASPLLDYQKSQNPSVVVAGSLGMALFVCVVTGLLGRIGLRVRL